VLFTDWLMKWNEMNLIGWFKIEWTVYWFVVLKMKCILIYIAENIKTDRDWSSAVSSKRLMFCEISGATFFCY